MMNSHSDQQPWHQGVSQRDRQMARALFAEGANRKAALLLVPAIAKYRQALAHWDHPEIRYELATVLAHTNRALAAWQELQTLRQRWGLDALEPEDRKRAIEIEQRLLREDLGEIEIRCDVVGAEVAIDGELLFVGPGSKRTVVSAGRRVISATKQGYFPVLETIALVAGGLSTVILKMSADRIVEERYVAPWTPWVAAGTGAGAMLVGAGLLWQAKRDFEISTDLLAMGCSEAHCSPIPTPYGRAEWENIIGSGALLVGSAVVIGGGILAIVNRPRGYRTGNTTEIQLEFTPTVSPKELGISVRSQF